MARRSSSSLSPALVASALGHVAVLAAALIAWPWMSKDMQFGKVVPVTLVTDGPAAEMAPALQAPTPAPAMAEAPVETAPPEPAPISPAPPTPVASAAPKPTPQTKANQAKPTPALKAAPSTAQSKPAKLGLDLDALLASVNSSNQRPTARESLGQQGANRPKTALQAQEGHGSDDHLASSEKDALSDKLQKLWNPNCQIVGGEGIIVRVHVRLTPQGFLAAPPDLPDRETIQSSGNPILIAAAARALSAVGRGQPYTDVLTPDHYPAWREMILKLSPQKCTPQ